MAIQCKELPFRLAFIVGNSEMPQEISAFYKSEEELYHVSPSIEVLEYLQVAAVFECDDLQAKLYIEGIDELVSKFVQEEDGRAFINPANEPLLLFSHDDYPLIPAYYQIVVETKGEFYYAVLHVKPIHVSEVAWEIMRDDLENILSGLAMDLVFRNLGFNKTAGGVAPLPPYSLFAFLVINKNFSNVMSVLTDLMTKVNFRLRKQYQEKPVSSGAVVDDRSFRYRLRRPEKTEIIMSPIKLLDYDLQENRWIKQIVFFVIRTLEEFLNAAEQQMKVIQQEMEDLVRFGEGSSGQRKVKKKIIADIMVFCQRAKKMQAAFKMLESAPWYSSVSQLRSGDVPAVLFMDSRYRILYKIYQQIKQNEAVVVLDKTYAYQWKRTDKLYEIWCFIQICKTLSNLGFEICGGWLTDIELNISKVLVPAISPGTNVKFIKDNVVIRVLYDSEIPYMFDETEHDSNPIYIADGHNKPDIKLDVYIDNDYSGSLLMDAKYKRPSKFWEEEKLKTHWRPPVMKQLTCYGTQCRSRHLYGNNPLNIPPVTEVWVIYPMDASRRYNDRFFHTQNIRFICLYPNAPNSLEERLKVCIQEFQNRATIYRQRGNG